MVRPVGKHRRRNLGMMMSSKASSYEKDDRENFMYIQEQHQQREQQQQLAAAGGKVGRMNAKMIGFQGYIVETVEPFAGFHHIVIAYCMLAFVLMYPFVVCMRHARRKSAELGNNNNNIVNGGNKEQEGKFVSPPNSELMHNLGGGGVAPPSKQVHSGGKVLQEGGVHTAIVLPAATGSACSAPSAPNCGEAPTNQPVPVTPTTTKSTFQEDPDDNKPLSDTSRAAGPPMLPPPPPPPPEQRQQHHHRATSRTHVLMASQQPSARSSQHPHSRQTSQVASSSGILSRIPSAATTGRLHSMTPRGSTAAWPRHRHSRRPSGDPSWQWRRAIQTERKHRSRRMSQIMTQQHGSDGHHDVGPNSGMLLRLKSSAVGMMSDLANSVLTAEQQKDQQQQHQQQQRSSKVSPHQLPPPRVDPLEAALYARKAMAMRQRQSSKTQLQPQIMMRRPSYNGSARSGSLRSWNDGVNKGYPSSVMSSIVDDISPADAADADDPGKIRAFPYAGGSGASHHNTHAHRTPMAAACCMALEPWLDVAEPNEEWKRLMGLAFPVTVGAMVEPVARCILMGILSQWVGTHAMVAYLLVQLLYRMTGETLSVAITDAESALVQMALTSTAASNDNNNNAATFTKEGYRLAGQYVQLACLLQMFFVGTVLLLWYFWIDDVIYWWVESEAITSLAKEYFQVIVFLFLVQALHRSVMVPCHMRGSEHSTIETVMDIAVTAITLITIVVVLSRTTNIPDEYQDISYQDYSAMDQKDVYSKKERLDDSRTALITVGWIQVNIGIASCVLKVAFCVIKGWLDQFWGGLLRSVAFLNVGALCNLLVSSIPLIMGSLLELGEVDLLTFFVQALGPAEVAAWAMMGSLWDTLEASTEGICEAAAIRVAFHLSASQPALAKKLAHKALFWTMVKALFLTSLLLLVGRHLIVALTVDYTLQHLLDDLLGLMALANLSMAFAQVCWSLIGAQGRFNLATLIMLVCRWLVTMPLSLIFIFAMCYDEETLAGAVAVGTATSACVLASLLFSSDWNELAQELFMQGLLACDDDDDFDFSFGDDDDSDDDDDDDSFGVGGSGYPSNKKSMDNDDSGELPLSTEPTTRTGSGVNSGAADSGVISGGTVSGMSGS